MGAQELHAIVCWALLSQACGALKQLQPVNSSVVKDSAVAGSAYRPKLYQNVRLGPYAAPYQAYSFNAPVATTQVALQSSLRPIVQGFKDSYGQFVKPQMGYNTQPQQFVQIQGLPAHLTQPLAANSPVYQYKLAPNFFGGTQYSYPSGYTVSVAPTVSTDPGQPKVYSESFRSFTPSSSHYTYGATLYPPSDASKTTSTSPIPDRFTTPKVKTIEHQESASVIKEVPKNLEKYKSHKVKTTNYKNKYIKPQGSEIDSQNIQSQTKITAIVNGEPTSVTLDTKPPLPLLDLSLLEPLTFETPLVTQMQHFLPKLAHVHAHAHDHKLNVHNNKDSGEDNGEDNGDDDGEKRQHQEIIVEHTNTYDTGVKKIKNHKTMKQDPKPPSGTRNGPELVYEINTPNHREIIKEEVVSYKKETKPDPVHHSYGDSKQEKPKVYSYVHNSQDPLAVTRVNYHNENNKPKHFVSPDEEGESYHHESGESNHSGESSAETDGKHQVQSYAKNTYNSNSKQPKSHHYDPDNGYHSEYHNDLEHENSAADSHNHSDENTSGESHDHSEKDTSGESHYYPGKDTSGESHSHAALRTKPKQQENHRKGRQQNPQQLNQNYQFNAPKQSAKYQSQPSPAFNPFHDHSIRVDSLKHQLHHHSSAPRASDYHGDHKQAQKLSSEVQQAKQYNNPKQQVTSIKPVQLQYYTPKTMKLAMTPTFVPVHPDIAENMRLYKLHRSHAAIKVDPDQRPQYGPTTPRIIRVEHTPAPLTSSKAPAVQSPYISNPTHIHEKSKKIILKNESPEELHMHTEQLMEQMIGQEENNEKEFEKGYKQSAFGFPGFEELEDQLEKDIFNPDAYGVPHEHHEFKIDNSPFEKYQQEGDVFPKSARLLYKDSADNTKEDYYLDYSVSKPDSFLDHHKHKADYYKMYKKQRPEKIFAVDTDKKRKPEKHVAGTAVAAPSFIKPIHKQFYTQFGTPMKFEMDFSQYGLHDSSGFHSIPAHFRYESNAAEPQLQLASYSNLRPVILPSEFPMVNKTPYSARPMRKKLYKENWYIKKTTTDKS